MRLEAATEQPRREELIDAAVAMARRLGDEEALATLLPLSVLVALAAPSGRRERRSSRGRERRARAPRR